MTNHQAWLDMVREDIVDPGQPVVDCHHHLFKGLDRALPFQPNYGPEELEADIVDGHRVSATVHIECMHGYRSDGPAHLRPVGETEFVMACIEEHRALKPQKATIIQGIVAFADLRLGDAVEEVFAAHREIAGTRFKGIRQMTAWHHLPEIAYTTFDIQQGMLIDSNFQKGFACLEKNSLSFDCWAFHTQLDEVTALAQAFPATTIIVNHLGGPIGIGRYKGKRQEVMEDWQRSLKHLAGCPNVVMKLGGLNMHLSGYHWSERALPPTSDELLAATGDYYLRAIEIFGPGRCLFESNFPVDKISCSYRTLWNLYKKIAGQFSSAEADAMLRGNAEHIYRLG